MRESLDGRNDRLAAATAISYALSRDVLVFFGLLLLARAIPIIGHWLIGFGPWLPRGPQLLFATAVWILGAFVGFVAIVGLVAKLLVDTRQP